MSSEATTYKSSGVDISAADEALARIKPHCERTHDDYMYNSIGPFAGGVYIGRMIKDFDLDDPILLQTIDGPGTIPLIANLTIREVMPESFRPLGYNVAAHCFADLACAGAYPITLLDCIDSVTIDVDIHEEIVAGMADACGEFIHCPRIVGGEIAQLRGLIVDGKTNFCATAAGLVDATRVIDPQQRIRPGGVVVGIQATGVHLNGISLIRKIIFEQLGMSVGSTIPVTATTVAEEMLRKQPNYALAVLEQMRQGIEIWGNSNITGGGLYDNIERNLPEGCRVVLDPAQWLNVPLFPWLIGEGNVPLADAYHTWNMGIGYVQIFPDKATANNGMQVISEDLGLQSSIIGLVVHGEKGVEILGVD